MMVIDRITSENHFNKEVTKLRKPYKEMDFNKKYKTEICKNWVYAECKFGDNCTYAHGEEDLRVNKTKKNVKCANFSEKFVCPYGSKCQFSHKYSIKKRLPVFIKLSLG